MKYNFEVKAPLEGAELADVLSAAEGLEGTAELVVRVGLVVNTELPDEMVETMRENLSGVLTDKLGSQADAQLISKEH